MVSNFSPRNDDGWVENAEEESRYVSPKEFRDWLKKQVKRDVLNPDTDKVVAQYLGASHSKGVVRVHAEADKGLASKEYKAGARDQFLKITAGKSKARGKVAKDARADLEKATQDMEEQIDQVVADGLEEGLTPKQLAKRIIKRVDVGATRARRIAHYRVVEAHAEGQLDALEELGAPGVGVMVENAPDGLVCDDCAFLAGQVFSVGEARGLIPVHPWCRCALVMVGMAPRQRKRWQVGKRDKA